MVLEIKKLTKNIEDMQEHVEVIRHTFHFMHALLYRLVLVAV